MAGSLLTIDGSQGEGGGQILRTAVGLAAALGLKVRVVNIRAGRPKPGLRNQHLVAVRAAAAVCGARIAGDALGSTELTFKGASIRAGDYRFNVGTAGSTVLVLQTILPALSLTDGDSSVTVLGGTHNPLAPCFEYMRDVFSTLASAAGVQAYSEMTRVGFYPAGGGEVRMMVRGLCSPENLRPLRLIERGTLRRIDGLSAVSKDLPIYIVERQSRRVLSQLAKAGRQGAIEQAAWDTCSPGSSVFLRAAFGRSVAGFSALGEHGKPAEQVADEAVLPLLEFLDSPGVVDTHAADQLLPIAALCSQESYFVTDRASDHLLTNAAVIRQLTGRGVLIEGDRPASVTVKAT